MTNIPHEQGKMLLEAFQRIHTFAEQGSPHTHNLLRALSFLMTAMEGNKQLMTNSRLQGQLMFNFYGNGTCVSVGHGDFDRAMGFDDEAFIAELKLAHEKIDDVIKILSEKIASSGLTRDGVVLN